MLLQMAKFHSLQLISILMCVCVYIYRSLAGYSLWGHKESDMTEHVYVCLHACTHRHTYHIFFIHSSVDGHLVCVHILAIINSATMSIGVFVSF